MCLEYYTNYDDYTIPIFGNIIYHNDYQNIENFIDNKIINSNYNTFEKKANHNIYVYIKGEITNFSHMFDNNP